MDKGRMQKIILIFLILCGIFYAYYSYVFKYQMKKMNEMEKNIIKTKEVLTELTEIKKDEKKSKIKLYEMEKKIKEYNNLLPNNSPTSKISLDLYYYLKEHRIEMNSIQPLKEEELDGGKAIKQPIELVVTGKKPEIKLLIEYLKNTKNIIRITECNIKIVSVEQINASIIFETYYLKKG